jgi:hypothetical protein
MLVNEVHVDGNARIGYISFVVGDVPGGLSAINHVPNPRTIDEEHAAIFEHELFDECRMYFVVHNFLPFFALEAE